MTEYKMIAGTTYAYSFEGEGEDCIPLVLLHGFTGTQHTWNDLIMRISHRYRIMTIDLPGHGKTVAKHKVTMDQFVQDLYELTRSVQFDTFHLLGYSLGGRTALSYAMHYPETIRSLILESASPGLQSEEERLKRMAADKKIAEMIIEKGIKSFVAYWENIPIFDTQKRLEQNVKNNIRNERMSQSAIGLAQSLLGMGTGAQTSWWESLSSIPFPLLLIVGALDEKFIDINKSIQNKVATATLHIVENAGHAVHIEQKDAFARIVYEYIDKI